MKFNKLLIETIGNQYEYIGQCDLLRKNNCNEKFWQDMMKKKSTITMQEFVKGIDPSRILDDDETFEQYVEEAKREDKNFGFYKSTWDDKPAKFMQHGGFEFVFVKKDLNENERQKGEPLSSKISTPYITIYRAVAENVNKFVNMDYVTLSRKFAVEHAENNHIVYDTPHIVLKALVSTDNVFDAYNPSEYFYSGKEKKGKVVYETKGVEFEGYDELTINDFFDKKIK